ncbi:MAG: hypothetical protein LBT80_00280 [Lactobacillaceae bacterium]|jgi:hypothetical protein|nr:hypothetical protein [Lactobacillaceae bacterium]
MLKPIEVTVMNYLLGTVGEYQPTEEQKLMYLLAKIGMLSEITMFIALFVSLWNDGIMSKQFYHHQTTSITTLVLFGLIIFIAILQAIFVKKTKIGQFINVKTPKEYRYWQRKMLLRTIVDSTIFVVFFLGALLVLHAYSATLIGLLGILAIPASVIKYYRFMAKVEYVRN